MATVKKSNKKKVITAICIVLVIAIIITSIVIVKQNSKITKVSLNTIATSNIVEDVNATGEINSGSIREYKVATVANVKECFVKVGDKVKKGDKLATFDTQTLQNQINSLQTTYDSSSKSYNEAVANQANAKKQLAQVNSQIVTAEKTVAKMESNMTSTAKKTTAKKTTKKTTTKTTTKKATTIKVNAGLDDISIPTISTTRSSDTSDIKNIAQALETIAKQITELTDSVNETNRLMQTIATVVAQKMADGDYDADNIAKEVTKSLIEIGESETTANVIGAAVKNIDWEGLASGFANTNSIQLTTAQMQLAGLYAQREIFTASSNNTVVDAQRQIRDSSKSALDTLKDSQKELETGWVASMSGTITECNLEKGAQTSALTTGIKLENSNSMVVKISLSEYDVHKVKVGMVANVTTAYGKYDGEVTSIAPTATGGSQSSVLDSVGSMAGVSGLSSLTSSGAGVECAVTINKPDANIIPGFDAKVQIKTGEYTDVTSVPIESICLEKDGTFVYLYNEEDKTVTKTKIETGAVSDAYYEVTSGIKNGDKIISAPQSDYKTDTFKVKVVEKSELENTDSSK